MSATKQPGSGRPQTGEFADYAKADIDYVKGDDAVAALTAQLEDTLELLGSIDDQQAAGLTYAPGKWTLKEVIGHMIDDERIFAYRMLCVARGDQTLLPGFEEKDYVANSDFEQRTMADLIDEYCSVREATLSLLSRLTLEMWLRQGIVNAYRASTRGLAFHIAGHELHHLRILRSSYLALPLPKST
jgi:DinB superfamily